MIQITNHGSSINHAGFLSNGEIFALSHDESFSIYPFSNPGRPYSDSNPSEFGDLRSALSCEYIVDVGLYGTAAVILSAGSHRYATNCRLSKHFVLILMSNMYQQGVSRPSSPYTCAAMVVLHRSSGSP